MIFCSKCGTANPDESLFCASCGTALATAAASQAPDPPPPFTSRGSQPAPLSVVAGPTGRTPALAAVLSAVIPGVGQFYNDDRKKGLAMFVGAVLAGIITGGVAYIAICVWSIVDGYRVASGTGKVW